MAIQLRTTSQLDEITDANLLDNAFLPVSQKVGNSYVSKKVKPNIFAKNITTEVEKNILGADTLNSALKYMKTLSNIDRVVGSLSAGTGYTGSPELKYLGAHRFEKLPKIDEALKSDYINRVSWSSISALAVNMETMKEYTNKENSLLVNSATTFSTKYFNVENQEEKPFTGIASAPETNGDKHNQYLFRLSGYYSNIWTATDNGMFTCFGWVDTQDIEPDPYFAKYWIALEGEFKYNDGNTTTTYWKILNLQPVYPNPYCVYVSFMFPVNKDMRLRLRSGFNVGQDSDKYASIQGSLTNHIPNAFIGGVYSRENSSGQSGGSSSGGGTQPDKYLQSFVFDTKDTLQLSARMSDNTTISAPLTREKFVSWLSNDIVRAVLSFLPEELVTRIDSSNIKIAEDVGNKRLSVYNVISAESKVLSNILDDNNMQYPWRQDSYTTSGDSVLGLACRSDRSEPEPEPEPEPVNLSTLYLKVPVVPCSDYPTVEGLDFEQFQSGDKDFYLYPNQTSVLTANGESIYVSEEDPEIFLVPVGTYSSREDMNSVIEDYGNIMDNYISTMVSCSIGLKFYDDGENGTVDSPGPIDLDYTSHHYPGTCPKDDESYIFGNGFSSPYYVSAYVTCDSPAVTFTFSVDDEPDEVMLKGVQNTYVVPACKCFSINAVADDSIDGSYDWHWNWIAVLENGGGEGGTQSSYDNAISEFASIPSTTVPREIVLKQLIQSLPNENEDERNYSKLIDDIKKEIED